MRIYQNLAVIAALLFSSQAMAAVTEDFDHVLTGRVPLTEAHIEQMYHLYNVEHAPQARPSAYYKNVTNEARKEIFANKVREII
jgi:hypothetical protein